MANIKNNDLKLTAEDMNQVKGGGKELDKASPKLMLTGGGDDPLTRKRPGRRKFGNITLKP